MDKMNIDSEKKQIVIYGAGQGGRETYQLLEYLGMADSVAGFCTSSVNADELLGKRVDIFLNYPIHEYIYIIAVYNPDYLIQIKASLSDRNEKYYTDVKEYLTENGMSILDYNREYCAFFHKNHMDKYYAFAETDRSINGFWSESSLFYAFFSKLDTSRIIELACGHGRHVLKYMDSAEEIVLVDILEKNIDYCRERFSETNKISYYRNNGFNLEALHDDHYTALFCYDAMVHFGMMDIYEYLKDIHRVLIKGGMALLHHSNKHDDYRAEFSSNINGRGFMSKELFAYLSYSAGFEIVSQKVIDWAGIPNLDCLTLIRK